MHKYAHTGSVNNCLVSNTEACSATSGELQSDFPLSEKTIILKDLYMTKGVRTTAGSNVLKDYIAQYDATVVTKIKEAGARIIGKANLDAWGHGSSGENSDFGPTKNPFNKEYVPGGSSSGSAVAVATGLCDISGGTDTGGSVRLPACFTGTVGMKPTYGRVSRYGIIAMASSLDTVGHITKDIETSAKYLEVVAGHDPYDATSSDRPVDKYTMLMRQPIDGMTIGIPKEYFAEGLDDKVAKKVYEAKMIFEKLGAKTKEISLPHTKYANECYYIIMTAEVSSNLARYDGIRYGNDRSYFGAEAKRRIMLGNFVLSSGYADKYYKKAQTVKSYIRSDFENAFQKVDVILSPVSPTPAWKIGEKVSDPLAMYLSDVYTVTANLAGIPAIALPAGKIDDLPIGFQLMAPHFREDVLFRFGWVYEKSYKN